MLAPCEITKANGSDRLLRVSKRKAGRDVAIIREIFEGNLAMIMMHSFFERWLFGEDNGENYFQ